MAAHKTSAWPLAQAYALLIVYASLYPFEGWRMQGISPWAYLASPWPRYWTGFDVGANVAGYVPLGFLLALSWLRRHGRSLKALGVSVGASTLLSLAMEALQTYLPARVPSNVDLGLNLLGALSGAVAAICLEWLGAIDHWSRFRRRWFVPQARGALVLLALWPFALLFPAAVPLGLGQVFERLEGALADWLMETPFLEWLPVRDMELEPLVPGSELISVALGVLAPCLLGYSIMVSSRGRAAFTALAVALGVAATALSAALSFGPAHAWAWMTLPVRLGLLVGLVLAIVLVPLSRRGCAAVLLLTVIVHLSIVNQAPENPYFAETLQAWEQGRFIRFNGLAQWLGWVWPYAVVVYVLQRLSGHEADT